MASDLAVIIELLGEPKGVPVRYTIANATGVEKGELLILGDPRTAVPHRLVEGHGNSSAFIGIAAHDKVANDGSTTIAAYTYGIFDLKVSGTTVTSGQLLTLGHFSQQTVKAASSVVTILSGSIVGKALETAADPETIAVLMRV